MPLQLPAILGYDLAGQVVALGEGVTGVKVDALVLALATTDIRGVCHLQSRRPGAYAGWAQPRRGRRFAPGAD
jgi:NADPH:quinone reductase-like Zn-dependent oxidoreductase